MKGNELCLGGSERKTPGEDDVLIKSGWKGVVRKIDPVKEVGKDA